MQTNTKDLTLHQATCRVIGEPTRYASDLELIWTGMGPWRRMTRRCCSRIL